MVRAGLGQGITHTKQLKVLSYDKAMVYDDKMEWMKSSNKAWSYDACQSVLGGSTRGSTTQHGYNQLHLGHDAKGQWGIMHMTCSMRVQAGGRSVL